jgi:hypothetical protein
MKFSFNGRSVVKRFLTEGEIVHLMDGQVQNGTGQRVKLII